MAQRVWAISRSALLEQWWMARPNSVFQFNHQPQIAVDTINNYPVLILNSAGIKHRKRFHNHPGRINICMWDQADDHAPTEQF